MHQGDYNSYYQNQYSQFQNPSPNPNPNPNPNPAPPAPIATGPTDLSRNTYASAPPFTGGYGAADYSNYSQNYQPYGQNSDHVPPSAPSFTPPAQPPPPSPPATSLNPNSYSTFNQPPPPTVHPPASSYGSFDSTAPYQQSTTQPMYYPAYDQHQTSGYSSAPPHPPPSSAPAPNPNPVHAPPYSSSLYAAPPYSGGGSSMPPSYDKPVKFDQSGYGDYNRSRSDVGSDLYGKRSGSGGYPAAYDDSYGDGVYAYEGGKVEPYGSRGTAPKSSNSTLFDDYGRSISFSSGRDSSASSNSAKIVRAVPKADSQEDATGGVQKFRVKLLAETYGQTTTDVLCQVNLA